MPCFCICAEKRVSLLHVGSKVLHIRSIIPIIIFLPMMRILLPDIAVTHETDSISKSQLSFLLYRE